MDLRATGTLAAPGKWARRFLIASAIISAVAAGSFVTAAALADTTPASVAIPAPRVNVDSLYAALAARETPRPDTSAVVALQPERTLSGRVSWYGPGFHGRRTANGERFDRAEMTAAHRTLPFGSLIRVVDDHTGRSVLVRVNDRGPFSGGRILDLSEGAARRLGIMGRGTASVHLEVFRLDSDTIISFDADGHAILPRGYAVRAARTARFEEAINLQHRLIEAGYDKVLITRDHSGGSTQYNVTIGLFSTERLCRSLLAEIPDDIGPVALVRFANGAVIEQSLAVE